MARGRSALDRHRAPDGARSALQAFGSIIDREATGPLGVDLAGKAREAGEDTFTYGLMYQREVGRAASMEPPGC